MAVQSPREVLIERLRSAGTLVNPAIEAALRAIPRDEFVRPDQRSVAWADRALPVKYEGGEALSSISQPTMVVMMLELADLEPGHRVLEVGTATGYNAALIDAVVGPSGHVVTIEIEADLAASAAARLERLGIDTVEVLVGDGAAGHPAQAPYDRIIVTAGAAETDPRWVEQLREGGRLIVPIVDDEGMGVVRGLVKHGDSLEEIAEVPCAFLRLRPPASADGADGGT